MHVAFYKKKNASSRMENDLLVLEKLKRIALVIRLLTFW